MFQQFPAKSDSWLQVIANSFAAIPSLFIMFGTSEHQLFSNNLFSVQTAWYYCTVHLSSSNFLLILTACYKGLPTVTEPFPFQLWKHGINWSPTVSLHPFPASTVWNLWSPRVSYRSLLRHIISACNKVMDFTYLLVNCIQQICQKQGIKTITRIYFAGYNVEAKTKNLCIITK